MGLFSKIRSIFSAGRDTEKTCPGEYVNGIECRYTSSQGAWVDISSGLEARCQTSVILHQASKSCLDSKGCLDEARAEARRQAVTVGAHMLVEVVEDGRKGKVTYYGIIQKAGVPRLAVTDSEPNSDPLASGHYLELETVGTVDFSGVEETYDGEAARRRARIIEMAQD